MFENFIFDQVYEGVILLEDTDMSEERYNELLAQKLASNDAKQRALFEASAAAEKAEREEREAFLASMTDEEREEYLYGCRLLNLRDDLN